MTCPNCPGPKVPHHCLKTNNLRDDLEAFIKGKRVTGPVGGPPGGRPCAAQRKQRTNAWSNLESSEESESKATTKPDSMTTPSTDEAAQVLGATSKHKAQCLWKPTLRPTAKRISEPAELHATPILLDHTVATAPLRTDTSPMRLGRAVSRTEDGDSCRPLAETTDVKKSQCVNAITDAADDSKKQDRVGAAQLDLNSYINTLLSWLNYEDPQRPESSISQDTRSTLFSVAQNLSVIICGESDLSGVRKPWGDDVLRIQAIAAWSMEERRTSWKSDDWRMDLQALDAPAVEYLMFCSIEVHRKERWERHQDQGYDTDPHEEFTDASRGNKFMVACHLCSAKQASNHPNGKLHPRTLAALEMLDTGFQGQYFVITCPPNIVPLQFATISCIGDQARWCSDKRLVLPLPE